jgi:glycosyltransferase involved in cell wall biosynthesis
MKICFYARLKEAWYFDLLDFYSNDIKIFRELGHEVITVHDWRKLPNDCDLYFIWWWSSGVVPIIKANRLKKPVITIGNIHYTDPSDQGYFQRPFYIRQFIKYSLKHSDVQIATAKIELDGIKKLGAANPVLIYHAVDSGKYAFKPKENREDFILTLTQLTKPNVQRKKVREIILAFSNVSGSFPKLKLYIVGNKDDDGYNDLLELVKSKNLEDSVEFLGRVSDKEKIDLYQRCKIYMQPTNYEGFGMAIAESMLCGAPVITSRNGAVPEVCGDSALYINPVDIQNMSNGIIKLMSDDTFRNNLGIEGSKRIKDLFSYEVRKENMIRLLAKFEK